MGRDNGETCVIELSGLPANSLKIPRNRNLFRRERLNLICEKIRAHNPKFVVMCGANALKSWEEIAGVELKPDIVVKRGLTLFVYTTQPGTRGKTNSDWLELGRRLRLEFGSS
jgi:hypothetical protein